MAGPAAGVPATPADGSAVASRHAAASHLEAPAGGPLSVLAIGAHPDDIEIGAGGLLLGLAQERPAGPLRRADGDAERQQEARNAAQAFMPERRPRHRPLRSARGPAAAVWERVKEILEDVARSCSPDLIIAPSSDDAHQDHRTIGEIMPTVFRDQLYLAYEIPKWDGDIGRPSVYVPLSAEHRAPQGGAAAQVLPVPAQSRLVGRRGLPGPGALARHGVPGTLRRGIHLRKISDRTGGVRAGPVAGGCLT